MIKEWLNAIRIHTLPVGATPVIMGVSLAHYQQGEINISIGLITLLTCILLQGASNLVNDYYDGIRGTDNEQRIGFERATASGAIAPQKIKKAFCFIFTIAFFLGVYLSFIGGIKIFILGLIAIFFAYIYTAGPFPLSHYALGEVAAFIFFGPIAVTGSYYLQTSTIDNIAIITGMIPGFLSATIMAINNLRDRKQDKLANKRTLANSVNEKTAKILVLLFLLAANIIIVYLGTLNNYIYLGILPAFLFLKNWIAIYREPISEKLNQRLKITGKYLTLTGIIISIAYVIN